MHQSNFKYGDSFEKVLFIAPNYKLRKGGIASVLKLYNIELNGGFNFSPSIYFQNIVLSTILFPINILELSLKLLVLRRIRIVHIHGSHGGSFYRKFLIFLIVKSVFKKKVIYHLHSSDFKIFYKNASKRIKQKIAYLMSRADVIIVLSGEWKDYILSKFEPQKIKVLENIVEKQADDIVSLKNNQKTNLLFLGRIGKRKGVYDLIESINSINDSVKHNISLTIGGDGEVEKLKKLIKDLNLDNVNFVGWVKGAEKINLLKNTDVFVLPSYNEGLPISLLEAMSFGKPIISTNVGGIPRILKNEINGFVIEPGNKAQLQEAILKYVNHSQLIKKQGQEGLKIVEKYYPERVLEKLSAIYGEVL